MGYVNDPDMVEFIPANTIIKSAGTWTTTLATNTVGDVRTAAAAGFNLFVPIMLPANSGVLKGAQLQSIDLHFKIGTLAMTSVTTVELEKVSISNAGAVTGAAVGVTVDAANDTSAKRAATGDHFMNVALNSPAWLGKNEVYWLYVTFVAVATTAFTLWGAKANYLFRV